MEETSTRPVSILEFRQDIEAQLRRHIHEAVDVALREELAAALHANRHERSEGRCGYRNGTTERALTTATGTRVIAVPRGRVRGTDGTLREFHSELVPRYARRTADVDDAIVRCYLGGINSRRIRTALKPLLGTAHLSKSAVSRIVARLKTLFATWQSGLTRAYPMVFSMGCG